MKSFKVFIIGILICLSSLGAFAASEIPDPISTCGLSNGNVISGDGTLCKEDIAFGLMYEMFPSIFKEIGPLWSLTSFSQIGSGFEDRDLLGQYHGDAIFITLYALFFKLVLLCAFTYILFLVIDVASRVIRGKALTDDNPGEDNGKSWAIGSVTGVTFMLPYKDFFIGQIIVFTFAIAALSSANFGLSIFLSYQGDLIQNAVDTDRTTPADNLSVIERHDYIADTFYRYLISMSLCQRESTSIVMTRLSGEINSPINYKEWATCVKGEPNHYRIFDPKTESTTPSFIHVYETYHRTPLMGRLLLSEAASVDFRGEWASLPQCVGVAKNSPEYYCGSISINEPDWASNPLLELMDSSFTLINSLDNLSASLSPDLSPSDVNEIVYRHWTEFYEQIKTNLNENVDRLKSEDGADYRREAIVAKKKAVAKQLLMDQNGQAFRQLARFYHQSAQNIITFGRSTSYRELGTEFDPVDGRQIVKTPKRIESAGQNIKALMNHMEVANKLADHIHEAQCLSQIHTLEQAKKTVDFLNGETSALSSDAHSRCVDILNNSVVGYSETLAAMSENDKQNAINARLIEIEKTLMTEFDLASDNYARKRRAIENSFKRYIKEKDSENWIAKMRQEGYLSIAGYTFNATAKIEAVKREIKQIVNNVDLRTPQYDNRYFGQGLYELVDEGGLFPPYVAGDEILNNATGNDKIIDPFVDNSIWLAQQAMLMRQPTLTRDEDWGFSQVISNMSSPLNGMKRLGIDIGNTKDWRKCQEDPARCPFPITDPLLELSLMGHDMLDTGISFYVLAIGMKGVGALAGQSGKANFAGSVGASSLGQGNGDGTVKKLMRQLGGLTELVFSIMSTLLLVYIAVGAVLAYLLPLLPFIYIYMGFITWVMVVVMASFSIMLWCFFWIRFREKRDLIKEAGTHYAVDMLFKPLFNLISVVVAWAMFFMLMFIVGMTSSWITILPLTGEGAFGLRSIIDPLFILIFIGLVFAVALKFSYQVMDEMSAELLTKLGVKNKSVKDSIGNVLKVMLYDRLMDKGQQLNQKISRGDAKRNQKQAESAFENMQAVKEAQRAQQEQRANNQSQGMR